MIHQEAPAEPETTDLETALLASDQTGAFAILETASRQYTPFECISEIIVPALDRIGSGWENGELALSQIYMSGRICEEYIEGLNLGSESTAVQQPKIAIAVLEDYHALGKQTVLSACHAAGLTVTDYGAGISVEELVEKVLEDGIEILLISALMLRAALRIKVVTDTLHEKGARTKVIVGGAPFIFDETLWQQVGADGMGKSATDSLEYIDAFVGGTL